MGENGRRLPAVNHGSEGLQRSKTWGWNGKGRPPLSSRRTDRPERDHGQDKNGLGDSGDI